MWRWPDNPTLVSEKFLRCLDSEPAGTYLAQSKLDGVRRLIWLDAEGWHYRAKNRNDAKEIQPSLKAEFESLPWPRGVGLDCELVGPRQTNGVHALHIFDIFQDMTMPPSMIAAPRWIGGLAFHYRLDLLERHVRKINPRMDAENQIAPHIYFVPAMPNPGMYRLYQVLQNSHPEICEGIVVRRADSTLIGSTRECAESPTTWKIKWR